jgi:pimeloyl-ACP methyl ester carboxylesterase
MAQATTRDGLRLYYEDLGKGEPALLLTSGWCQSHAGHGFLPAHAAKSRRVLALDWRGHGQSDKPRGEFGVKELIDDCEDLVKAAGVNRFVPVALHHSGWMGIELRRRHPDQVPALVLLHWVVLPPAAEMGLVKGLVDPSGWKPTSEALLDVFMANDPHIPEYTRLIREEMPSYGADMWRRAGREIGAGFAKWGSPLEALASLDPPCPTLHIYSQPDGLAHLAGQEAFAQDHPWFQVKKVDARTPFAGFEIPDEIAAAVESFLKGK